MSVLVFAVPVSFGAGARVQWGERIVRIYAHGSRGSMQNGFFGGKSKGTEVKEDMLNAAEYCDNEHDK